MSRKIRVAVTGLSVSRGMMHFYRQSPEVELVLLHDINEEQAKQVSAECGGVKYTKNFDDVLNSDADMIDVSTPNHCHAPQTIAALKAGKHVLCQKPLAPTIRECHEMCETAEKTGRQLGVLMSSISMPIHHSLRALIQGGYLGKIASVRQRNAHRIVYRRKDKDHWRSSAANVGGGSFIQLAVHNLNLVQWMLDDRVVNVCGFAKNLYCQHSIEGEDAVAAAGEFGKGPLIVLESGYSSVGNSLGVYGTDGHFVIINGHLFLEANAPFKDACIEYPGRGGKAGETVEVAIDPNLWDMQIPIDYPHIQQLQFARCIRDGKPFPMSGRSGLWDVAVTKAIYQSSETGNRVNVEALIGAETAAR